MNIKKHAFIIHLLTLLVLCCGAQIRAEEQSVRPGINDHYQNPDFRVWQQRFETPGREVFDMAEEIVDVLNITPGMHIADIGAGTGLFSRQFARRLKGSGRVYAVDISKEFVANILRQSEKAGLKNIRGIVNSAKSSGLDKNSIELAFICDTYHHFEYPRAMLKSIHRALRKNGRLVVIDFRKQAGISSDWVMGHVRASRQTVRQEIESAGFRYLRDEDMLQRNYFMIFQK